MSLCERSSSGANTPAHAPLARQCSVWRRAPMRCGNEAKVRKAAQQAAEVARIQHQIARTAESHVSSCGHS